MTSVPQRFTYVHWGSKRHIHDTWRLWLRPSSPVARYDSQAPRVSDSDRTFFLADEKAEKKFGYDFARRYAKGNRGPIPPPTVTAGPEVTILG